MATRCHTRFEVTANAASVKTARHLMQAILEDWNSPVDHDTAVLLLSELVTNVLLHAILPDAAANQKILIVVRKIGASLYIAVHDPDQTRSNRLGPHHAAPEKLLENGRGLELVDALAARWGIKYKAVGKYFYFVLAPLPQTRAYAPRGGIGSRLAMKPTTASASGAGAVRDKAASTNQITR
ncbi:MAG TPA: ATP-binding protein [Actinocrinis sp.]|jgi:anti-sigma regulatory factor (Ser/Thr protein kinase)|nr:ATP-binding protein [Actinocrinis sp.]